MNVLNALRGQLLGLRQWYILSTPVSWPTFLSPKPMKGVLAWTMCLFLSPERWEWWEEDPVWAAFSSPTSGPYQYPQNQALPETFLLKDVWVLSEFRFHRWLWGCGVEAGIEEIKAYISFRQDGIT